MIIDSPAPNLNLDKLTIIKVSKFTYFIKTKEDDVNNSTFSFNGEDHTIGNLMRLVLMKE